jgi:ornithine cyclodeaminase
MARTVRILKAADVRAALDMASCIDACDRAFAAYATGDAETPDVIHLDIPQWQGEVHVKAGYLHGAPFYAVKVASGSYGIDPPAIDGLVVVFNARDGSPAAFLLDKGFITDLRTGAAGGVAATHLAPQELRTVAVIGTGAQAAQQIDALSVVRPGFAQVRLWGRDTEHAARRAADLRARLGDAVTVTTTDSVEAAVSDAELVVTCTASHEPLVQRDWLKPGAHVTAVGSDGAGKQELDPQILADADLLVVDSRDQCLRIGELQHAPGQADRAVELGVICDGSHPGRTGPDQLSVCDLTGLGVQDVAAANVVMARAGDAVDLGSG